MKLEILYTAWNRLDFVTASWAWMLAHTDWTQVSRLVAYDDGSEDGTLEFLREQEGVIATERRDVPVEVRVSDLRSPTAIMNHYLATSEADIFAKIDSDIALPGSWLEDMLSVMRRHSKLELLGMEAGWTELVGRDGKPWNKVYDYSESSHIGGVGLMRTRAFKTRPEIPSRGGSRQGFTEWQNRYGPKRGFIRPDLMVPQLDRVPLEPWVSLSAEYVAKGWQREWGQYDAKWMEPYWAWTTEKEATA